MTDAKDSTFTARVLSLVTGKLSVNGKPLEVDASNEFGFNFSTNEDEHYMNCSARFFTLALNIDRTPDVLYPVEGVTDREGLGSLSAVHCPLKLEYAHQDSDGTFHLHVSVSSDPTDALLVVKDGFITEHDPSSNEPQHYLGAGMKDTDASDIDDDDEDDVDRHECTTLTSFTFSD